MKRLLLQCFLLSVCVFSCFAQEALNAVRYRIETFGSVSDGEHTPFWMVSNQQGIIPIDANNGFIRADVGYHHIFNKDWSWDTKVDVVGAAPRYRNFYFQQLYTEFAFRGIRLSIGSHELNRQLQAVSDPQLSSGDLGLGVNARPIPEINMYSPDFIVLPWVGRWVQAKGNFGVGRSFDTDYLDSFIAEKQYYIRNILWHNKSLFFQIKDMEKDFPFSFVFGFRHFAQWGGESTDPQYSDPQPHSFKDFIRVVFGVAGGSDSSVSDQINKLGAHYGTYDFRVSFEKNDFTVNGYYQHLIGDGSSLEFKNSIDGLIGVSIETAQVGWIRKIVFEHLSSLNQSGPFHFIEYPHSKYPGFGGGGDNYYNNGEYASGFSYFNRSLGSPFFISPEYNSDGKLGFKHNRLKGWYISSEGKINSNLSWRLRLSLLESLGIAYAPTLSKLNASSLKTDISYSRRDWTFSATVAADHGSLLGNNLGFGLSIVKQGIISAEH
ncbi:MAG: capsule assembly Wzi family protein [Tannerella sp.]|jgi:hypothetical protein|nr:capsule assembly Wzi family protein [Tannerella sp.]